MAVPRHLGPPHSPRGKRALGLKSKLPDLGILRQRFGQQHIGEGPILHTDYGVRAAVCGAVGHSA